MTIRQLSESAGCHIDTVRKIARSMYPEIKAKSNGLAIDYNESESVKIMDKLPKRNNVNPSKKQVVPLEKPMGIDYEALTKSITMAIKATITPLIDKAIENKMGSKENIALLAPKQDRNTLRQLVAKYAKECCSGEHNESWHYLYEEIYYRLGFSIRVRAKNKGVSKLDMIDELGIIYECCSIMREALI